LGIIKKIRNIFISKKNKKTLFIGFLQQNNHLVSPISRGHFRQQEFEKKMQK
jgi:hypothetical protein